MEEFPFFDKLMHGSAPRSERHASLAACLEQFCTPTSARFSPNAEIDVRWFMEAVNFTLLQPGSQLTNSKSLASSRPAGHAIGT